MGYYNSFLVRVWTEDGKSIVRGHIQHVGSRESMHFRTIHKMAGFIMDHLGWHANEDADEGVEHQLMIPKGEEPSLWEQF